MPMHLQMFIHQTAVPAWLDGIPHFVPLLLPVPLPLLWRLEISAY